MARIKSDAVRGLHGKVGDFVYKTFKDGSTFATKPADRSKVKSSKEQSKGRKKFANAVKFAQDVMKDPKKASKFRVAEHKSLYHTVVKEFMKADKLKLPTSAYTEKQLVGLKLNPRQYKAVQYMMKKNQISNAIYKKINNTSKPTATRDLQDLVSRKILEFSGAKGAGAAYTLLARR